MRLSLSYRERTAVLIGAAVVAAVATGTRAVPVLNAWRDNEWAAATELLAEADRAERSVRSLGEMLDSLEQRRNRLVEYSSALVGSGTASSAAAALAGRISGAAAAAHVDIAAVQLQLDTTQSSQFARVAVRASGSGDIRGIVRLLADLEHGRPLLAVREWSVSQSAPEAPAQQPETLRVEFVVEGLALSGNSGAAQ